MARIIKSPVVGMVSSFMWSFNSQSQVAYLLISQKLSHTQTALFQASAQCSVRCY